MKYYIFFLLIIFHVAPIFAQNGKSLDSLAQRMEGSAGIERAQILYELVYAYLRVDMAEAKKYADIASQSIQRESDGGVLAYANLARGIYFSRIGKLDSATMLLQRARQHALNVKNDRSLTRIGAALAHSFITSGEPAKGLEYLFEALKVTERTPDWEMEMKLRTNIGWAYLELKQYEKCIQHGLQTLSLLEAKGHDWIALYTFNNVAVSYGALGKLDSAAYFVAKGINAAKNNNDIQALANGHFILGTIYSNAGKYALAIEQFLKAKPYREKVGNPFFMVSDLYVMADLYHKQGDFKKGVEAASQAVDLAQQHDLTLKFEGAYLSLAMNYEGLKDFKNASKYYQLYALAKDTVYKHASNEAIAEMQTRYETEKKEKQLAIQNVELNEQRSYIEKIYVVLAALILTFVLLVIIFFLLRGRAHRKRQILEKERELYFREAQMQASIQSQESERKRFARDLHDGMGQLISALRLALHTVNNESPLPQRVEVVSKAENILNEMYREIRGIAFNLMPQVLVQEGLVPALNEMCHRISDPDSIIVRVSSFDMPQRLSEVQEISLYRIIQEWVNNVMKYAHATVIEIQLIRHDNEITVTIEDNGNGFDSVVLGHSSGNGWKNILSRLSLVKGSYHLDSKPGVAGTTFVLTVPLVIISSNTPGAVLANTQYPG